MEKSMEEINNLRKAEFNLKKKYINYDKLVDDFIQERKMKIQQHQIEILAKEQSIRYLENDVYRIKKEQENSHVDYPHLFINPTIVYYDMTHPKDNEK